MKVNLFLSLKENFKNIYGNWCISVVPKQRNWQHWGWPPPLLRSSVFKFKSVSKIQESSLKVQKEVKFSVICNKSNYIGTFYSGKDPTAIRKAHMKNTSQSQSLS